MAHPHDAIPFLDLAGVNGALRDEYDLAWKAVLGHGRFIGGPEVARFEEEFADYCGASTCVGVGNGTDALELILAGLGIGPGDEVIVPGNTFIATAEAVVAVGARPRFVDVLPDTLLLDPAAVEAAVNPATAAVMAVHLYGQMADVTALGSITGRLGLALIEDAAQAHGARFDGHRAGSVGVAAGFSFYPGKNLGALGDGGAVTTSDPELATRIRRLADHGRSASNRYHHDLRGRNSRLDTVQAALLSVKLADLDVANTARRRAMEHLPVAAAAGLSAGRRRPACGGRPPPGRRAGTRPCRRDERPRRRGRRMGSALPGAVPPPTRVHGVRSGAARRRGGQREDRFTADVVHPDRPAGRTGV